MKRNTCGSPPISHCPGQPPIHSRIPAIFLNYITPRALYSMPLVNSLGATTQLPCSLPSLSFLAVSLATCNPPPHQHHRVIQKKHHNTAWNPSSLRKQQKKKVLRQGFEPAQLVAILVGIFKSKPEQGQAAPGRTLPEHTRVFARRLIKPIWKKKNKQHHHQYSL